MAKYNVREADLLPWLQAEAGRWLRPDTDLVTAAANEARRAELLDERERVGLAFTRRSISLEAIEARQAEIDAELTALADVEQLAVSPPRRPAVWPPDSPAVGSVELYRDSIQYSTQYCY